MQYRQIKVGGVYHIKDIYGDIVRVKVTEKKKRGIYYTIRFDYLDGNEYFGASIGARFNDKPDFKLL